MRIGVDIGGTFTDFVLVGDGIHGLVFHKQLTTPSDPSAAVLEGIAALLARQGLAPGAVDEIVHGTTLVTNAVIERRGARTGMLVTRGFADTLDIGLEQRYELFDLRLQFAPPVVGRRQRAEIDERIRADGSIETAIDPEAVCAAVARLVAEQRIEAVAVCFLHSYANPAHEDVARRAIAARFPELFVSTSADVAPHMREFERWTTTTVNAYSQPGFHRYLDRLERRLADGGFAGRFLMMSSSGGVVTTDTARRYPVRMLESGPAAGVLMSAEHGRRLAIDDLLAFDLGGTTAKGSIVRDGRPGKRYAMEVARCYQHKRGSGLGLKLPVVDMTEIGAGGGSIAAVDERGLLRVGPHSSGADPGPACYGRGGAEPTLTDANLVLGYLDPGFFLGGAMRLDAGRAQAAIAARVAGPLGIDTLRAAWGIHETINEDIARAFRMHAVERSFDTRRATIVAFGGGGPIHATAVGRKLAAPRVVFPVGAGVMSALGLLASPPSFEVARSLRVDLDRLDAARFAATLRAMTDEATGFLARAGVAPPDIVVDRRIDLRYRGQGYELEIALPPDRGDGECFALLAPLFAARYREVFRVDQLDEPIELVTWKVEARGPAPRVPHAELAVADDGPARKGTRLAYLPERGAMGEVAVYDRYRLRAGARVDGPALIEERESTCLLRAGEHAVVDAELNLIVTIER
ncbi:MAG: hydantoinase/oxoprolinase family protein [Alphaproteobacteria bacterium]|nr:hydantoinase/oxoprolinase family protein [Alphaproteobacteria bacterium]